MVPPGKSGSGLPGLGADKVSRAFVANHQWDSGCARTSWAVEMLKSASPTVQELLLGAGTRRSARPELCPDALIYI